MADVCESDAREVYRFGVELNFVDRLVRDGHSRDCASRQVWGDGPNPEGCSCKKETPTQ